MSYKWASIILAISLFLLKGNKDWTIERKSEIISFHRTSKSYAEISFKENSAKSSYISFSDEKIFEKCSKTKIFRYLNFYQCSLI